MSWRTHLRLGRVSNLPTVWTNVLAGAALSGVVPGASRLALLAGAMTLFYVGGMYLNDAFDREVDARERPERPIPAGEIPAGRVFVLGGAMLAAGWLVLGAAAAPSARTAALAAGALLAADIVLYNAWHKRNPLSPVLMGAARALVYLAVALAVAGELRAPVLGGALALLAYLIGLTYAAKQETLARVGSLWPLALLAAPVLYAMPGASAGTARWLLFAAFLAWIGYALRQLLRRPPRVPRAVVSLIAGISLLDALLVARQGEPALAALAVGGFVLTLLLQRVVAGT